MRFYQKPCDNFGEQKKAIKIYQGELVEKTENVSWENVVYAMIHFFLQLMPTFPDDLFTKVIYQSVSNAVRKTAQFPV